MGKKKRIKEIESLKLQNEKLQKKIVEIKENQFKEDFENAIKLLKKYGHLQWEVEYERNSFCIDVITKKQYTIVLDC